ncbi:l-ascorbate oxidase-like protein [Hordeum vulgare]|nr:l-ascorbate oxidase-like protein [Hordeum vulgare]
MVRGRGRHLSAGRAARGSRLDDAAASGAAASGSPVDRGRRGSRDRGCRGRGRGRRSAAPVSPSSPGLGGNSDGMALEFVMQLHDVLRGHLHLPRPLARAMEAPRPHVLWLRAHGCSHGAMQALVEYPKRHSMLLGRGWKAFARAHNLEDGNILRFKLPEENMLFIKFYGRTGVRLICCEESSRGAECPSSSDSDEGDNGGSGAFGRSGSSGVKSEYDSPGSE